MPHDEELVMRSVYLRPSDDTKLRQLAHNLNVTKSDLIRSAIGVKLRDWLASNNDEAVLRDLDFGRRDGGDRGKAQHARAAPEQKAPAKQASERRSPRKAKEPEAAGV